MKIRHILLSCAVLCMSQAANAQTSTDAAATVLSMLQQSMGPAMSRVTSHAVTWLGAFAALQFGITNWQLFKSDADIQAHVAKLFAAVAWVGVCLYIIDNGPDYLRAVGDEWMSLVGVDLPSPSSIMTKTIGVTSGMTVLALGVGSIPFVGTTAGQLLLYVTIFFLVVGMYFAFKIFMLQLEVALVAMLSPLSFAFLGLSTLRDQGIAPFKALISLGYRVILLTVLLSGYSGLSSIISDTFNAISIDTFKNGGIGQAMDTILTALCGYVLLAFLVWKSDAIAATLASGATSMGTGDVAQAAAAGAAVGAAIASGGALAGAGASRTPQAMSDFLSRTIGGGSMSNASPMGSGGDAPSMPPASPPASLSVASTGPSSGAPGARDGSAGARTGAAASSGSAIGRSSGAPATPPSATSVDVASQPKLGVTSGRYGQEVSSVNLGASASSAQAGPTAQGNAEATALAPESAPGSAVTAGVSGKSGGGAEEALNRLVDHLSTQGGSRKPTFGERVSEVGRHVGQEQAATHVSISPHHHD